MQFNIGQRRYHWAKESMTLGKAFISACLIFSLSAYAVQAAEPTSAPSPAPVELPELSPRWFVRVGVLSLVNQSSSRLYAQTSAGIFGVGPQLLLPGRGESFSNLLTVSFQAGYFVTPNWSLVLLCHKLALWQQGHRNKRLAMARASLVRMVAIDVLTWRSARIGGSSGSITRG
jgi:hypothetical protein